MKLIELIMKHVPRDNIRRDAKFFTQDSFTGDTRLSQFEKKPAADYKGYVGYWYDESYIAGSRIALPELAEDARNTVVTREQLNYLWILQDQRYTLVFDGSNPFQNPTDDLVDVIPFNFGPGQILHPRNVVWKNVIAYRFVKNESRSPIKEISVDVTVETKKRLELFDKSCDGVWPGKDWETFTVTVEGQIIKTDPGKIITRKMWDEYVSRKIRVGDKVKTPSGVIVTVLHVGEKNAFVRYETGDESALPLNRLNRVSE